MSGSEAPPSFVHSKGFSITESPIPDWKFGQAVDTTPEGREWLKGLESGWQTIDASQTDSGTLYKFMISGIAPRPVAFVSSVSEDGVENLGLFSWFNQVSHNPPTISISCTNHATRTKDTIRNIKATKGFTVNIISDPFVHNANACSIDAPPEISEWPLSGLTKEPSTYVKAPRVKESAFSMECELYHAIDIVEPNILKATNTLVIGLVKFIHIRKDVIDPARNIVDPGKLKPILRLGSVIYAQLGNGYLIPRPSWTGSVDEIKERLGDEAVSGKGKGASSEGK
ncbi:hypothetical protein P691DRAFT_673607 [Macrolepiota fuliginosa MF-IS2]|uniref:Flavin reductase like domain-containing protein n=1 Tax=Macrolepiota fuliginosa MF-IS2 TaxID=1400762 RepID=A0A9P5XAK3_9AGAR|nr:hypothetical protein P691DRAFT_673607 [Macrolepiota fuliginosa MF-IS2]